MAKNQIAVAMSGGVDSSVAAALLQKEGYSITGLTMVIAGSYSEGKTAKMLADAREVADFLGIEHVVIDLRKAFEEIVLSNFLAEYTAGRTPNPCIVCNKHIKFGLLLDYAREHDFPKMATGHYVRNVFDEESGLYRVYRGRDHLKDQSYMMYTFDQKQLEGIIFPLAHYTKDQVRQMAIDWQLPVALNAESQDICFIENDDYQSYMQALGDMTHVKGPIVDYQGHVIGQHEGIQNYTIGQRKGLGVALGYPAYVLQIDSQNHVVTLGPNDMLYTKNLRVKDVNWLSGSKPQDTHLLVKIRYRTKPQEASIVQYNEQDVTIKFDGLVRAITPGQSAVFYCGQELLGGGIIQD